VKTRAGRDEGYVPARCWYRGVGGHNGEVLRTVTLPRALATAAVVFVVAPPSLAAAVPPPSIDPAALPPDRPPTPAFAWEQTTPCAQTGLRPGTNPHTATAAQAFMNPAALWQSAGRGAGVTVAIIDSGVTPSARLPHLRGGGDYLVAGSDGLADCDAHGTLVASIIGAAPADTDTYAGIAPGADLISMRQYSAKFAPTDPAITDAARTADSVSTLAQAIVHAANLGANVINLSVTLCLPALAPVDQTALGAALHYAATVKNVVLVASSGNVGGPRCLQNPGADPANQADPRNWGGVVTVSSPSWFADYVLSVSATDDIDRPATYLDGSESSLRGPWVGAAAPGTWVAGLNGEGAMVDGIVNPGTGEIETISGASFAAAYTSGLAALIRAKFPTLTAAQVIQKIQDTAKPPSRATDNSMGHGVIDPLAALRGDVPRTHTDAAPAPDSTHPADQRGLIVTFIGAAILATAAAAAAGVILAVRRRRDQR
jgi:membrane-anchored mycosin MYCP